MDSGIYSGKTHYKSSRMTELNDHRYDEIEKRILLILKEQNVSLSQTRGIFDKIIKRIEDYNIVNL